MESARLQVPSIFPFLTPNEFTLACHALLSQCLWPEEASVYRQANDNGANVEFISITRPLDGISSFDIASRLPRDDSASDEDIDNELMPSKAVHFVGNPSVEYHILLSQSYQVPVLYLLLRNLPPSSKSAIDLVYESIVPHEYKDQIRDVGVMGAITFGDHPVMNVPALFLHPCNTADALRELASGMTITVENYLVVWLGLIGGPVGLAPCLRSEALSRQHVEG